MTAVRDCKDLRAWQVSMDLVTMIYRETEELPDTERFGLVSQLRRAAVSIPSNIAEGHQRESTREYLHHLSIAQGSLAEVETQVEVALRLDLLSMTRTEAIRETTTELRRILYSLRNALQARLASNQRTDAASP